MGDLLLNNKPVKEAREEYDELIRPQMTEVETSFEHNVQVRLDSIYGKVLDYAKHIFDKKISKAITVDTILSEQDFNVGMHDAIPALRLGIEFTNRYIKQELLKKGITSDMLYSALGINFDMRGQEVQYINLLKDRQNFLAKVLKKTTLKQVEDLVETGIRDGLTYDQIAVKIEKSLGFDRIRARKIARNESNWAFNEGARQHMKQLGFQRYAISPAVSACERCLEVSNSTQGQTEGYATFNINVSDMLPIHPNCRCSIIPIIPKEWLKLSDGSYGVKTEGGKVLQGMKPLNKLIEDANSLQGEERINAFKKLLNDPKWRKDPLYEGLDAMAQLYGVKKSIINNPEIRELKRDVLKLQVELDRSKDIIKKSHNQDEAIALIVNAKKGEDGDPGRPGDKGYSPIKGKDYFTEGELFEIKKSITPVKGKDYFTNNELKEIVNTVKPIKGKDYYTESEIKQIIKSVQEEVKIPVKGEDYYTKHDIEYIKDVIKSTVKKAINKRPEVLIDYDEIERLIEKKIGDIQIITPRSSSSGGGISEVLWGDIDGPITNQTDLITYLSSNYLTQVNAATTYLKIDQTTPQTIINGAPIFNVGLVSNGNITLAGSQKIIGGTGTTSDLTLQTTSGNGATGADMHFLVGNNGATEALTILNTGRVGVNNTAPSSRLMIGSGGSYDGGIYVQTGFNLGRIANFGDVFEITTGSGPGWVGQGIQVNGANRAFKFVASPSITADNFAFEVDTNTNSTIFANPTSGAKALFNVGGNANFIPTSGTATFAFQQILGNIGQTGGANGITRGLWINPTIAAAADWRGLEITPNIGWAIYQSGATAKNYFAGEMELDGALNHDGSTVGLYNVTPIARATNAGTASTFVTNTSLIANDTATFDGYTIGQVVKALRNIGILT